MKYSLVLALLVSNSQAISLDNMKQNLVQSGSKQKRISLESQKTITDAVNDVLKITQEREEGEGPKVSVHHTSSSSATPDVAYGAQYPAIQPTVPQPVVAQVPTQLPPTPVAVQDQAPVAVQAQAPLAVQAQVPYQQPMPAVYPAMNTAQAVYSPVPNGFQPAPYQEHHHHYEPEPAPQSAAQNQSKQSQKPDDVSEKPTVVIEKQVTPSKESRDATPVPENDSPNSSVLRAIAAANEQSSSDKVRDQREVADKLEHLERQSQINDAINRSVKDEEQKVIEEANKRMAEVHSRKAQEANKAAGDIQKAKDISRTFIEKARKEEADAISKVVAEHASAVVK